VSTEAFFDRIDSQSLEPYVTRNGSDEIIWFTTANENYAESYLPIFLSSLRRQNDTLAGKVLVITFSKASQELCLKIHHLCPIFVESVSGELTPSLKDSIRQGDQPHWRNFVWTTVEARLYILNQGYSFVHIDCDVFHVKDPWILVSKYTNQYTMVSSNSLKTTLSAANPGIQYVPRGASGIRYVRTWFAQRSKMGSTSGNQRALTTLLAKDKKMSGQTRLFPCSEVSNACCLRECCLPLWQSLDEIKPSELRREISTNSNLKWLSDSIIFHAACLGGTPLKKMRRYEKLYASF